MRTAAPPASPPPPPHLILVTQTSLWLGWQPASKSARRLIQFEVVPALTASSLAQILAASACQAPFTSAHPTPLPRQPRSEVCSPAAWRSTLSRASDLNLPVPPFPHLYKEMGVAPTPEAPVRSESE